MSHLKKCAQPFRLAFNIEEGGGGEEKKMGKCKGMTTSHFKMNL